MIRDNQKTLNRINVLIDMLILAGAYALSYFIRFDWLRGLKFFALEEFTEYLSFYDYMWYLIFIIPGYFIIFYLCGLYKPQRGKKRIYELFGILQANVVGALYVLSILYMLKQPNISRKFVLIFVITNIILDSIFRSLLRSILESVRSKGFNIKHVLIVGYSRSAEKYIDRVTDNPQWGYHINGILDDKMENKTRYKGISVIGSLCDFEKEVETHDYDEIAIAIGISEYEKLGDIVAICEKTGVHTKFIPDFASVITTTPYMEDLEGLPVINIRRIPLSNFGNAAVKRICDIVLGTIALIIAAIPMLIVAAIIKLTSPGPVLFAQTRVGLHNKEFRMYKFRSMEVQEESSEKKAWTTYKDPRVTKIGKFIRKTSIDELPQIFNVLKGDMSLIGPRPERPFFVDQFKEEIPRYMIKHQVRPGMTGWAQVNGFRGDTSIPKRIECDLYYIENWSLLLDIKILFLTVFKGFINTNAY